MYLAPTTDQPNVFVKVFSDGAVSITDAAGLRKDMEDAYYSGDVEDVKVFVNQEGTLLPVEFEGVASHTDDNDYMHSTVRVKTLKDGRPVVLTSLFLVIDGRA